MFYIDETNRKQHCYVTYGRQFLRYRWYKPILAGLCFGIAYLALAFALAKGISAVGIAAGVDSSEIIRSGATSYDDLNVNNFYESVMNLGLVAIMIPALFLTRLIVRDRPFSSYSSARGGWNWGLFFKCLGICMFTVAIPVVVHDYIEGFDPLEIKFTAAGFIALLILGPLQCIAEEYIYRGLIMQSLGSWFRIPVIAVFLQAAVFAASHPYNWIGKCAILASGLGFGLSAWIARGIESSSAIHVANNMAAFILMGLGLSHVKTEVSVNDLIFDTCMYGAYVIIMFIISRKTDWFNKGRKDDLAIANEKEQARRDHKAAKKQGITETTDKGIDFTSGSNVEPATETYDIPEETVTRVGGRVARNKDKY